MAYRGTFDYTLDAKNRLTVPPKIRSDFAAGVVLALRHDTQSCLSIWRPEDYDAYTGAALATISPLSPRANELQRFFFANSHDTELDSAGRVMIPARLLRPLAGEREVVVTGSGKCLEVWAQDVWAKYSNDLIKTVADFTSQLDSAA